MATPEKRRKTSSKTDNKTAVSEKKTDDTAILPGKTTKTKSTKKTTTKDSTVSGEISASEARLRDFIDFLPQIVFESDIAGKATLVSRYGLDALGYSQEDYREGMQILNMISPAQRETAAVNLRAILNGKAMQGNEYMLCRKDGSLFPGIIYTTLKWEEGKVIGFRGIVVDITERKKIEVALTKSETLFHTLYNNSTDAIFLLKDGLISDCNPKAIHLFNYPVFELRGNPPERFSPVYQPDRSNSSEALKYYFNSVLAGEPQFFEWQFRKKDRSLFFTEVSMNRIDVRGEVLVHMVVRDITERKKYENIIKRLNQELEKKVMERTAELKAALEHISNANIQHQILIDQISRESEKLVSLNEKLANSETQLKNALETKDKFFSIIAHDIKNPLYSITLNSEILLNYGEGLDQERLRQKHNQIYSTTKRVTELLENLLQWAKSQMGKIEYDPSEFDLHKIVNEIRDLFKSNLDNKKITIKNNISRNKIIYADIKLINTVIRNLVSNALKFSMKNSTIEVDVTDNKDGSEIIVTDHGVGIPKEKQDRIFMAGKSISTLGTEKEKGTGLGLLLCKEFVELHGGKIWVVSEQGKGSEFHFTIPFKRRIEPVKP